MAFLSDIKTCITIINEIVAVAEDVKRNHRGEVVSLRLLWSYLM
jgi:hypothetical protein